MRYIALATDYDGTLAHDGRVDDETLHALDRLRLSGRKLILVTGRQLDDLQSVFPRFDIFDRIVAENGAVVYTPETREKQVLADPPPQPFIDLLKARGVEPLSVGDVIVATWRPHETTVIEAIRDLGLELHVVFNKGAVMVLPATVNKMTGLKAALKSMQISEHNVAAVGDAENDHAFLKWSEFSAAVANALPALKQTADFVTLGDHGAGVVELIDMILADDLASHEPARRAMEIGREGETRITIPAHGKTVLIAGESGTGKSTFIGAVIESLMEQHYQVCLIDPEGDYESFAGAIAVGDEQHAPTTSQILQALEKPSRQVVAGFLAISVEDRPRFFAALAPRLFELRVRSGRPHWIVIDEAHHMLPRESPPIAGDWKNVVMTTVRPDRISQPALDAVDVVIALGESAPAIIETFCERKPEIMLSTGEALVWFRGSDEIHHVKLIQSKAHRKRHQRKYAAGELGEDNSFYFRGPENKLNLRAQNLATFLQIADGVDDETWLYHLKRGDYSRWFREKIKDDALAAEAEQVERNSADPKHTREKIRDAVERRYTAPA